MIVRRRLLLLTAASSAAMTLAWTPAVAKPSTANEDEVEELVVTGTRAPGRTRLDTISPVDVVSEEVLQRQGTTELAAQLATTAPSISFPRPSITDGTDSVRPATLRGLAPDQTLVLVNGARRHTAALVNVNGSIGRGSAAVDLNAIPTIAIDRVEVLRDGASAQYGSDAIAGVINLRLRQAREGGGAVATYGQYNTRVRPARDVEGRRAHDGVTYTVSAWQGLPLGEEGFLTVTGEYRYRNPTSRGDVDPRITPSYVNSRFGDPQTDDKLIYLNAGLPLNGTWEAYAWGGFNDRETDSAATPRIFSNASNVRSIYPAGFLPRITTDVADASAGAGVRGEVAGWSVDANLVYGYNRIRYGVIDSVNGSLGAASPTDFYAGTLKYDQAVLGLDVSREFEVGLAGPLNVAFGIEARNETYEIEAGEPASYITGTAQPGASGGSQGFPGLQPSNEIDKERSNIGAYLDIEGDITEKFSAGVALRAENYSDFGSTFTGKVSGRYDFSPAFALRGSVSNGFRAPSLQQQYFTATSTNFQIVNGVSTAVEVGTFPATSAPAIALGAEPLDAEESMNYTLGAVLRSGGLELTIDAYRIDINDRVVLSENLGAATVPAATAAAIVNFLRPYNISAARFFINGVDTETTGVDIVARYALETSASGRFDFTAAANFNSTDVTKLPSTRQLSALPTPPVLFDRNNRLAFEEGTPDRKFVFNTDWTRGNLGLTLKATYYGDVLQPATTAAFDYHTGERTLVDVMARYELPRGVGVAVGVDNLFDEYPNRAPAFVNTNGAVAWPNYSPFGFNGRFLYGRITLGW